MYVSETKVRVRYAETDKMGYVYYGNYAVYFEVGRVEALRQLGMSYREMEEKGIMLPVLEFKIKYFKPAYYDDELTIRTTIKEMPGTRIIFYSESINAKGDVLNQGEVTLVFVNFETAKPCSAPDYFLKMMKPYFSH
jgi:acyl-CoA thioester hydrolase